MNLNKGLLLAVIMFFVGYIAKAQGTELIVRIPELQTLEGEIQISVFDEDKTFLEENEECKIYRFPVSKRPGEF